MKKNFFYWTINGGDTIVSLSLRLSVLFRETGGILTKYRSVPSGFIFRKIIFLLEIGNPSGQAASGSGSGSLTHSEQARVGSGPGRWYSWRGP